MFCFGRKSPPRARATFRAFIRAVLVDAEPRFLTGVDVLHIYIYVQNARRFLFVETGLGFPNPRQVVFWLWGFILGFSGVVCAVSVCVAAFSFRLLPDY